MLTTFRHIFTFADVSRFMTNRSKKISVFISSTYEDLVPYRKAVWKRISEEFQVEIRGMETFGARSQKPMDVCLEEVSQSDIYVGIVGMRYGSVEKAMGRSFVELEYSKALESNLPILIYLIDENKAKVHPRDMDCENAVLLNIFKRRLRENHKYELFISEQDLSDKVVFDVGRTLREKGLISKPNSQGYIVASINSAMIALGDQILIGGKATEKPKSVGLWLFHNSYFLHRYIYIHPDGSFLDSLPIEVLNLLPTGQYFVLLQHPGDDNSFNVLPVRESDRIKVVSTVNDIAVDLTGEGSLKGLDAAGAVESMLNAGSIDDIYIKLTFSLEEPWISVDSLQDVRQGDRIVITGTTNLSPDNALLIQISKPHSENEEGPVAVGHIMIIGDEPFNRWSFELDTYTMCEGKYMLTVSALRRSGSAVAITKELSILKNV